MFSLALLLKITVQLKLQGVGRGETLGFCAPLSSSLCLRDSHDVSNIGTISTRIYGKPYYMCLMLVSSGPLLRSVGIFSIFSQGYHFSLVKVSLENCLCLHTKQQLKKLDKVKDGRTFTADQGHQE